MNALASYLRHLIVTGILLFVEKLKLPIEGANAAADVIALAVVGTLSWWFVKFIAPKFKPKHLPMILITGAWVGMAAMSLMSCTATWDRGSWWPQLTIDSEKAAEWANEKLGGKDRIEVESEK